MKTAIEMAHETLERMKADEHCREQYWSATDDELQAFANLVRADEREACAKVCERMWHTWLDSPEENEPNKPDAEDCYRAIRARGNT